MRTMHTTLPSVDALLRLPGMQPLLDEYGHTCTVNVIRARLAQLREAWRKGRRTCSHPCRNGRGQCRPLRQA